MSLQAEEIVELCDNAEKLFKQEKSVLELRVRAAAWGHYSLASTGGSSKRCILLCMLQRRSQSVLR